MSSSRFLLTPIAAAATLALWLPLSHAQNAPAPEGNTPTATLSTVTVNASADASAEGLTKPFAGGQVARGGRVGILGNQDIMETPFSSTSYTNELIQDQQAKSVADVLLNDPSVRTARGFGNFQELYMVRGFPVYSDDVAYNGLYGMLPRQYIAAEFLERVEVFRGANSFLNGAAPGGSGIGGSINLLPKRAPNEPLSRVGLSLQSGGQASVSTDIARRFGPDQATGIRLNAVQRDGGTGVDNEKMKLTAIGIGLDWRSSNVRISADIGHQDYTLTAGRPNVTPSALLPIPAAPDAKSNFAQPWTSAKERDTFATVRAEVDFNSAITGWVAGGLRNSWEGNDLANPAITNAAGATTATRFSNTREDKITTLEAGLRAKFATGSIGHTVVASAATYKNDRNNAFAFSAASVTSNIYTPVASAFPVANSAAPGFVGNDLASPALQAKTDTSSVAIADTLSFAQDTVLLTLGARNQTIKQQTFAYNTGAAQSPVESSRTTPVAGIVFKVNSNLSIYGNYIEGLVPGKVAPATVTIAGVVTPVTNAGAVFKPFHSKQTEIGAKYDAGTFGSSVALFKTNRPLDGTVGTTYGAFGEQRNQGLEFSIYGEPVRGLRLLGGLTLLDAKQTKTLTGATDGKDAIGVPRQQLNIGGEWDVTGVRGLALNARVIHTGKQYANAANTQQLPAWSRLDVGARYLMDIGNGRALTLRARVDNLLNKSYWASAGGASPSDNYLVMGAPRTFVVSGSIDF
jgi:iron complex outermembrane receptor protein